MSTKNNQILIAIAICTRDRPMMLENQLRSILKLNSNPNVDTKLVVVENGPNPISSNMVKGLFGENSYYMEPRVGLTFARNTAIERCLAIKPDWIAFFDDDEQVDENWLLEMVTAIRDFPDSKAFAGPVHRKATAKTSIWYPAFRNAKSRTGVKIRRASTGNILFHSSIYSEKGPNFRFDNRFNLTGGEDTFLFEKMRRAGFPMLWVQDAYCEDYLTPERSTLRSRFLRSVRDTHINGVIDQIFIGRFLGRCKNFVFAAKMLFHCGSYLMAGATFILFSRTKAQKYIAVAVQKFAIFLGYGSAIFLPLKPVYQEVDGH